MFKSQFKLSKRDADGLRNFCLFVVLLYTKAWTRCPYAIEAPKRDLDFLKAIINYENIDAEIHSAVLKKMCGNLWYLSEETIALSFFDDNVSLDEKRQLRKTFLEQPHPDEDTAIDKLTIPFNQIKMLGNSELHHFITENTKNFFERFKIPEDFLRSDPSKWPTNDGYLEAKQMLSTLEVVNDYAERYVKLMEDYNRSITKDEETMQFLLLTVSEYRKKFSGYNKSDLKI